MTDFDLTALLLWLGDAFLIIAIVAVCCCYYGRRRRDREEVDDDRRRHQEAAAAAAAASHAQPALTAAAVQMAAMAVALLDHVPHPRQNVGHGGGSGDDHPSVAEEGAICLGQFEDGDWCSVMPGCRHEFHRSCIAKWLTACNNTYQQQKDLCGG